MNTKRENIRDGRPIVFMFSSVTNRTKLILTLMTDSLKSKLFMTKSKPSRVGFLCAPSQPRLLPYIHLLFVTPNTRPSFLRHADYIVNVRPNPALNQNLDPAIQTHEQSWEGRDRTVIFLFHFKTGVEYYI